MAATDFETAVDQTITASNQLHDVINGTAVETVPTDSGDIPSLRKALSDNLYFQDTIAWNQGNNETNFNQIRTFTDGSIWWAPSATTLNPIPMGATPVGDGNWFPAPSENSGLKAWKTGFSVTDPNQLYVYLENSGSSAFLKWYLAPTASVGTPIIFSSDPLTDTNFVEYTQVSLRVPSVQDLSTRTFPVGSIVVADRYYPSGELVEGLRYLNRGIGWPITADNLTNHSDNSGNFLELVHEGTINIFQSGAVDDWNGTTGTDNAPFVVSAASNARVIYLPDGDFAIGAAGSAFFQNLSDKTFRGEAKLHKTGSKGIFSFNACFNITVEGITFDGQIVADEAANGNIIDATRSPVDYAFAISFADCNRCFARNNTVFDFAWDGIVAQGTVDPGGTTATVSSGIVFEGNRLSTVRGSQLWIKAVSDFSITGNIGTNPNTFNQKANFIFIVEWCSKGYVSGNECFFIGDNAIAIGQIESDVQEAINKEIVVTGNVLDTTRYHTILVASASDILISSNIIRKSGAKDNMPGGADAVLTGGITILGGSDGVIDEPTNTRIIVTNNDIHEPYEFGIYAFSRTSTPLASESEGIIITDNQISSAGKLTLATRIASGGIRTQLQKLVAIHNNRLNFIEGDGIRCFGDASIRGNTLTLINGLGINIPIDTIWSNTQLTDSISDNSVFNATRSGILIAGKDYVSLVNNITDTCGTGTPPAENITTAIEYAGLAVYNINRVSITGCRGDRNGSSGIVVRTCPVVHISNSLTSDNGKTFTVANLRSGVYMEGTAGQLIKATILMGQGDAGTTQQYPIRILFNDNAVAAECKYGTHPNSILGAVEKFFINI